MNAEFQWWLLILGIVIGGALVYLVLAEVQGDPDQDDLLDRTDLASEDNRPPADPSASGDWPVTASAPTDGRDLDDAPRKEPREEPDDASHEKPRDHMAASGGSSAGTTV